MSEAVLQPYAFGGHALSLDCSVLELEAESTASGDLLLTEQIPRGSPLEIAVTITIAPGTLERVLPAQEASEPPISIAVLARSSSSRFRAIQELAPSEDHHSGKVRFEADLLFGRVTLSPVLVRTSAASPPIEGYASHRGALLASGNPIDILLEEPSTPPGGYLDIKFEDFSVSADQLRRRNDGKLFAIDFQEDYPKIWLNSSIAGFEHIIRSSARRGIPKRIRDATYDTLCCQVWTALISASVGELASAKHEGMEDAEAVASLPDWEQRVLMFWSDRLFPELSSKTQALAEICVAASREGHGTELQERVTLAVQAWAGSADAFSGLNRLMTGEPL